MYLLFQDNFVTTMIGKFADKSGLLTPSVASCRNNYHLPGVLCGSRKNCCRQVTYSHQIVSRGGEGEHPAHPFYAAVTSFPEITHGFDPAEDFLHPFAQALTDGVARVPAGPAVNGRGTPRVVLGHMGYGIEGT
jgi:hypothetical protein